jgi:hypothetical protein
MSDEKLAELLGLLKGADTLELKLTVPESEGRSALAALDIDPLDAQIRQVFFFDTPDLTLDKLGVVVRARRSQGSGDDTVVKLRPVVPDQLSPELRKLPDFGVEVDAMPGGFVCSASFKGSLDAPLVRSAARGEVPLRKLYTKDQRAFFAQYAPDIDIDGLSVLGPITVFKLKFVPEAFGRKLVAELWNYPDGSRILELSTKCAPNEAFQVAAEARVYLRGLDISLSGEQQTKTRTALEYFSSVITSN